MRDEHRQQLVEQYEEAAISLLMDEYAEADGARLLQEYETAVQNKDLPEIPAELDAKCKQLIDQSFGKRQRRVHFRKVTRGLAKVAVFAFVFLGMVTVTVLSVDALRIPVLNYFFQQERYSSVSLDDRSKDVEMHGDLDSKIASAPIPEGYELAVKNVDSEGSVYLCYDNSENDVIILTIGPLTGLWNIDTEDTTQTQLSINEYRAIFIERDGYRVIWINSDEELTYELYASNIEENVFIEIALFWAE